MAAATKTDKTVKLKTDGNFNEGSGGDPALEAIMKAGGPMATLIRVLGGGGTEIGTVDIKRQGEQIILPPGMSYKTAREWLTRQEQAEETVVNINHEIACFPLDGMVALMKAFERKFGYTQLRGEQSFWGENPPHLVKVDTNAHGGYEMAPWCKLLPPPWEGGYLQPQVPAVGKLIIGGQVKKKFEGQVRDLLDLAQHIVKTESIYKGKAFRIDLSFMPEVARGNIRFDPTTHRPYFLDMTGIREDQLILNKGTRFELEISVLMRLKQAKACIANNISIKHGVLMVGKYGTGKSTSGMVLGSVAEDNDYTFIYNKSPEQLVEALALARLYAPAVLFCEDIDELVSGERNQEMNNILEAIDGIEAKTAPVICVFTSNNPERIHPAFLRPGRIDTVIEMPAPDAETAAEFVKVFTTDPDGQSLLAPDVDMAAIGRATEGMVAATISEVVRSAKCRTMSRVGENLIGQVTGEDIELAARYKHKHLQLTMDKPTRTVGDALFDAEQLRVDVRDGTYESAREILPQTT